MYIYCKPKIDCADSFKWLVAHRFVGKTRFQPLLYLSDKLNTNTDRCQDPICFQLYVKFVNWKTFPENKLCATAKLPRYIIRSKGGVGVTGTFGGWMIHILAHWLIFKVHKYDPSVWCELIIPFVAEFLNFRKFRQYVCHHIFTVTQTNHCIYR